MRLRLLCRSFRCWFALAAVAAAEIGVFAVLCAAEPQTRILVLYATRRDAQLATIGDRELPRILEKGLSGGLDYYSEFIDRARFSTPDYQAVFLEFLRSKYLNLRFDAVVAMDTVSFEFVDANRQDLFRNVPTVFVTNRHVRRRPANSTGIVVDLNLAGTISLAIELQPEIRYVFVVSGADERNRSYEAAARAQFRSFEPRLEFTYLSGLATKDLEGRLGSLPDRSIVYYLLVDRDGANETFHPLEYVQRIAAVSRAPVYSWVDSTLERGIVGGSLKDQEAQVRTVGGLTLRVLRGEPADSIPIAMHDFNVRQVDWRQLRRWGISESRVPADTRVRFRDPPAWDRYRTVILLTLTVLVMQSALIAGMLFQRARRRLAEKDARNSQAQLRSSFDRIRDLGARLLSAQEGERARIARELHDDVGQQMALLNIDLELLGAACDNDTTALALEARARAQHITRSLHDLSHSLHPAKLRLIGLVGALESLQREHSRSDLTIRFSQSGVPALLPPELTLCVYRVVQEALQNAIKYSQAREVSIRLHGRHGGLALTIFDNGIGFHVESAWNKGLGLISMSERVEAIGGTLRIYARPGAGTKLVITIPYRARSAEEPVAGEPEQKRSKLRTAHIAAAGGRTSRGAE